MRAKVVVVGPPEAGKSTLIGLISSNAMNVSHRGRTVGMDHGSLRAGNSVIAVVGVPGQPRFAAVREVLLQDAVAAIWVHPSGSSPDPSTVSLLAAKRVPYAMMINQRWTGKSQQAIHFDPPWPLQSPFSTTAGNLIKDPEIGLEVTRIIWRFVNELSVQSATD